MPRFSNISGTTESYWRIGATGPVVYQGTADPTVTPPTALGSGFVNGDLYFRTTTGNEGMWIYEQGVWHRSPSGLAGGTFHGPIALQDAVSYPNASVTGSVTAPSEAITIGATNLYHYLTGGGGDDYLVTDNFLWVGESVNVVGNITIGDGLTAAPSLSFGNDPDTGIYSVSADQLGISVGGVQAVQIDETAGSIALVIRGDLTVEGSTTTTNSATLQVSDNTIVVNDGELGAGVTLGTAGLVVDRGSLTDTNILWTEASTSWVLGGDVADQNLDVGNIFTAVKNRANKGTPALPGFAFVSDTDTGIHSSAANTLDLVTNGTVRAFIGSAGNVSVGSGSATIGSFRFGVQASSTDYATFTNGTAQAFNIQNDGLGNINLTTSLAQELNLKPGGTQRINLSTAANGIEVSSNVVPDADSTYSLGAPGLAWTTVYGVSTRAKYGDLAERYHGPPMKVGTVVCISGGEYEVTPSNSDHNQAVLGVVSDKPGFVMNDAEDHQGWPTIALRGRVPVLVVGTVRPGDLLVSTVNGHGRVATQEEVRLYPYAVFAKALSRNKDGMVEAVIL